MRLLLFLTLTLLISVNSFAQTDTANTAKDDTLMEHPGNIPSSTVSADVLENEMQSQDVSGLLQSSRDVFSSVAGFNLSAARFRARGYGSENYAVMMNGVKMNDPESGWAIWSNWGGLNDITRYQDSRTGVSSCQYNFGGIGGFSNIETRASMLRKGTRFTYSLTNRSYRHRTMLTHSTGMMSNGWAATLSLSSRLAGEGYVEGTYYSAMSYFLSLEKKLNDRHSIGLVGFGAPTVQGRSGIAVQEIYDLTGTNYYNPYWGYQDGEKRNARVRNNHKPVLMLSHYFTPGEKTKLNTTAYFQTGRGGQTGLTWYDAKDPRPDYYRYLPSYYEEDDASYASELTKLWQTDDALRQINWDQLYFANAKNLYTVVDAEGETGNEVTGNRSKYIVEEYRSDPTWMGLNSIINTKLNDNLIASGGLNISNYKSKNFKIVEDLLGGDFWVDVDQFAEQDFSDPTVAQNDLGVSNNVVYPGEKFGYDYDINVNKGEAFAQAEYTMRRFDVYVGLQLAHTQFWRTGNMQNGRFPDNSFGDSEKQNFLNYGVKAGAVYKLSGRHFFSVNGAYLTRPASVKNAYLSPRTRDALVSGLTNEQIISGDVNYIIRYPNVKARLTWYYTEINNQVWNRSFWHDELRTFVNYTMTGVDYLYSGMELGIEAKVMQQLTLTGAFATGDFLWNSRPVATITADNSSEVMAENRTVYLKNYRLGWMPQTAASAGVKYSSAKFWYAGANFNWFDDIWLDANPDRRTEEAVAQYVVSDPQWSEILDQTKLESGFTLDVFGGKSFRIKQKYYLFLMLSVSNILNNTSLITGGYEQLRYDSSDIGRFPHKYSYMYGTTYYTMVRFSF